MSSSNSNDKNTKSKSVRFAAGAKAETTRETNGNTSTKNPGSILKSNTGGNRKRPRTHFDTNPDEMDDVDDYVPEPDELEGEVPSYHEQLKAKRQRRHKHEGLEDEDDDDDDDMAHSSADQVDRKTRASTQINATTSLESEGIPIEPFHMDNERQDGSGYFDGDTYVFRKRAPNDSDDEADAWLEQLDDDNNNNNNQQDGEKFATKIPKVANKQKDEDDEDTATNTDHFTKEDWYARLLPLVSDTETIMQAVVRYGNLLQRQPLNKKKKKHAKQPAPQLEEADTTSEEAFQLAQKSLNDLTEAANALLGLGEVDIYQKTRNHLLTLVSPQQEQESDTATGTQQPASAVATAAQATSNNNSDTLFWEYKGQQDGQIHGPYSSEQMRGWIQAGYFRGAQAVEVRSLQKQANKSEVDDLLNDLMDDDDDDDDKKEDEPPKEEWVRGEWESSETANF